MLVTAKTVAFGEVEFEDAEEKDDKEDGELSPEPSPLSLGVLLPEFENDASVFESDSLKICFNSSDCALVLEFLVETKPQPIEVKVNVTSLPKNFEFTIKTQVLLSLFFPDENELPTVGNLHKLRNTIQHIAGFDS